MAQPPVDPPTTAPDGPQSLQPDTTLSIPIGLLTIGADWKKFGAATDGTVSKTEGVPCDNSEPEITGAAGAGVKADGD